MKRIPYVLQLCHKNQKALPFLEGASSIFYLGRAGEVKLIAWRVALQAADRREQGLGAGEKTKPACIDRPAWKNCYKKAQPGLGALVPRVMLLM
jgi:hypothetical protein